MSTLRIAKRISTKRFLGLVTFCLVFASLSTRVQVQTGGEAFRSFHPRVEFGEHWESHLIVSNIGQDAHPLRLFAYDTAGHLLGEIPPGPPLSPGEQRMYSQADGAWPPGTAAVQVESSRAVRSVVRLESGDGKGVEVLLPTTHSAEILAIPLPETEQGWRHALSLLHAGSASSPLDVMAVDPTGQPLGTVPLPELAPTASSTVVVEEVLAPSLLRATATLGIRGQHPLIGLQVLGFEDGRDVAALPAPLSQGQQLTLPVFQEAEGVALWTMAGLVNPHDGPVHVSAEAFDAAHRSLGRLPDLSVLAGRASHRLLTANAGGTLPAETALLTITADQPLTGYALIGALEAQGLTAVQAVTEHDRDLGYELVGSHDGDVLAAAPLLARGDGTPQSVLTDRGPGWWTSRRQLPSPEPVADPAVAEHTLPIEGDPQRLATSPGVPTEVVAQDTTSAVQHTTFVPQGLTVGRLDGRFAVTHDGAATYTIPLWTPPGRAGIEPDLALHFNSRAGNGALGIGWSLVGTVLSSITRCERTVAHDGFAAPIQFDSRDRFCLDGERLVSISGEYGADGTEYRTEHDRFAKIVSRENDGIGPRVFDVYLRDGRILTYGAVQQGRRIRYSRNFQTGEVARFTIGVGRLSWALSTMRDRSGNSLIVSYTSSEKGDADEFAHEQFLNAITYTYEEGQSQALKRVSFEYDTRILPNDPPIRPDELVRYVAGFKLETLRLLKTIHMSAATKLGERPAILRSYQLSYDTDPVTGVTRLRTVHDCDSASVCMPPTTFDWSTGGNDFEPVALDPITDVRERGGELYWIIQPADINGDGRDDILYRRKGTMPGLGGVWFYRLSTGEGFGPPVEVRLADAGPYGPPSGPTYIDPRVLDLELDGKMDIAVLQPGYLECRRPDLPDLPPTRWIFYSSQGTVFQSLDDPQGPEYVRGLSLPPCCASTCLGLVRTLPLFTGDLNGDGLPDVVGPLVQGVRPTIFSWGVRLNVAGELQPYQTLAIQPAPPTVPGPAPAIRIPRARLQRGSYLVDIDGVGRAVLLTPDRETPPSVYHKYYPGGDYFPVTPPQPGRIFTPDRSTILFDTDSANNQNLFIFPDVNGDGLPDAVSYPDAGGHPFVRLNTGGDFSLAYATFLPRGTEIGQSVTFVKSGSATAPVPSGVRVLDFNQDGRQDLLLVDAGVVNSRRGSCRSPTRTHLVALISTGPGFFVPRTLSVPVGDFASGATEGFQCMGRGYKLSQLLDVNGDGLTDLVQVEKGQLRLYVRRGKAGLLTKITDGYGAEIAVNYRPISDSNVHTSAADCRAPRTCMNRGLWVVSAHTLDDGTGGMNEFQHQYGGMATDAQGRGFLGAASHLVNEVRRRAVHITQLDNATRQGTRYPLAGLPVDERTVVHLDDRRVRITSRKTRYEVTEGHNGRTFSARPAQWIETDEEFIGGNGEVLRTTATALAYDAFGNLTDRDTVTLDRQVAEDENIHTLPGPRLRMQATYQADVERWLISQLFRTEWTGRSADGATEQRTVAYDPDVGTGLLNKVIIEPDDEDTLFLQRRFERNVHGLPTLLTATDRVGTVRTTSIVYDSVDGTHPATVTNSLGQVRRMDFDPQRGLLTMLEDENGVPTSFTYDAFGRIQTQDFPDHGDVQTDYLPGVDGPLQVTTRIQGGQDVAVTFDRLGRSVLREARAFSGEITRETLAYEPVLGRVRAHRAPFGVDTPPVLSTFAYDNLGRVITETLPTGTVTHDYVGRRETVIDGRGNTRLIDTDLLGRIAATADVTEDGRELWTRYSYAPFGELATVTDPGGNVTRVVYDRLGRRTRLEDPNSGLTTFEPNAFGEVVAQTDANGVRTVFKRDGLGRVFRREEGERVAVFEWDTAPNGIGKLARSSSADGVVRHFAYDALGRLRLQTWDVATAHFEVEHRWDDFGRLAGVRYPETPGWPRFDVTYEYGDFGHLQHVKNTQTDAAIWSIADETARGQIRTEAFANGLTTVRSFQGHTGLLSDIATANGAFAQLLHYDYDGNGNLRERTDVLTGLTEEFRYDFAERLEHWETSGTAAWTVVYGYDDVGNLRGRSLEGAGVPERLTFEYGGNGGGPHAITGSPWGTYSYDKKGNQVRRPDALIEYTPVGLPSTIAPQGGGATRQLTYDADHLRVRKRGEGDTMYIGGLYERRQQGIRTEHVFYVVGRDRVVAQLSRVERRLPFFPRTEDMVYLHADHLGSIETVTDATGAVLGHRKHDPFGNQVDLQRPALRTAPPPSPLASVRLGFTEHEEDVDLGLINMVGRIYDPKIGRFLTPDPITTDPSGQGLNGYSYVRNNPLTFVDPLGLICCTDPGPPPQWPPLQPEPPPPPEPPSPGGPSPLDFRPGAFDDAGFTGSTLTLPTPTPLPGVSAPPSSLVQVQAPTPYTGPAQGGNPPGAVIDPATGRPVLLALDLAIDPITLPMPGESSQSYEARIRTQAKMNFAASAAALVGLSFVADVMIPGSGLAARGGLTAVTGVAGLGLAQLLGQQGQRLVPHVQNFQRIASFTQSAAYRVPDVLDKGLRLLGEIKNVTYQPWSLQLQDFASWAMRNNYQFNLYINFSADLSSKLKLADQLGLVNILRY